MLSYDTKVKRFVAREQAGGRAWEADLVIEDGDGPHTYRTVGTAGDGRGKAGGWALGVQCASVGQGLDRVTVSVRAAGRRVLKRVFLRVPGGRGVIPSLRSSRTRMMALPGDPFAEKGVIPLGRLAQPVVTSFLTVLSSDTDGRGVVAGVGAMSEDLSSIRVDGEAMEVGFEPQRAIEKEETYCVVLGKGDDPLDVLDNYGRYMRQFGRTEKEPIAGWNSWDYYGASVTTDDIREEMAAIKRSPLKGKLTHVIIDMGWWTDWGDFTPNRRFPVSYRGMAKEIEAAGFVPGIWHAPLQASPWSYLGRHRQDLLVQAESGAPETVGGNAILDWSKPEVLQLLHDWFSSLRKAGFRYFKLDYIYSDAVAAMVRRENTSIGLAQVIRNGLKVIREAVGEDSYILNCGAARESSVGITDASRICTDIHTFWSHIWHNSREIACHLWENGNLWNVDPDFALVRSPQTSDDPFPQYIYHRRPWTDRNSFWMAGPEASFEELKVWLTVCHMAGGEIVLSDSIARLNDMGIEALCKLFPRMRGSARPLDMFRNPFPRFWLGQSGKITRVAVFNWDDRPMPIVVPEGIDLPSQGVDVWTGRRVKVKESTVMKPRSAYLLEV
jgi:hypothetical protein